MKKIKALLDPNHHLWTPSFLIGSSVRARAMACQSDSPLTTSACITTKTTFLAKRLRQERIFRSRECFHQLPLTNALRCLDHYRSASEQLMAKKLINRLILQPEGVKTSIQFFILCFGERSLKSTCLCDRTNPELKATREIIVVIKIVFLETNKLA